jgi:hypothetical protein
MLGCRRCPGGMERRPENPQADEHDEQQRQHQQCQPKGSPSTLVIRYRHLQAPNVPTLPLIESPQSTCFCRQPLEEHRQIRDCGQPRRRVAPEPAADGFREQPRDDNYLCRAMKSGASTSVIVLSSLMTMCSDGPAVSLNGSPTVSPTTAASCAGERLPSTLPLSSFK